MYLFHYTPSIHSINGIIKKPPGHHLLNHQPWFRWFSECCGTNPTNTSHISFLQQGCSQEGNMSMWRAGGQDSTLQPSTFTPAAPLEASQLPQSTLVLYIWILLYFNSTKLLILSQNRDGGTSFQHTNIPDQKFAGGYITVSQPTCHREKHQVTLEGNCKSGVFRKSTVPQK